MPTIDEAIKRLHYSNGQRVAVAIWCEDDVLGRAKELGKKCSRAQAREIIDSMDHKQDCTMGITWDTIDCYLYELNQREAGKE